MRRRAGTMTRVDGREPPGVDGLVHYAAIYKQLYSTNLHSPHSNVHVHGYPSLDTHVVGTMTRPGTLYI